MARKKKLVRSVRSARKRMCKLARMGKQDEQDAKVFYNEFKSLARRFAPQQADRIEKIQNEEKKHHETLKIMARRVC